MGGPNGDEMFTCAYICSFFMAMTSLSTTSTLSMEVMSL